MRVGSYKKVEDQKLKTMQDDDDDEHNRDDAGRDRKLLEEHWENPKSWARHP